jgi:pimeloyl-ACP methyl ester carboxylesterase
MAIAYLHGFASGPGSTKGQFFHGRLAALGIELLLPDLTRGDFSRMTISGELAAVEALARAHAGGLTLIGSSLGGYIAALYAARRPERMERLVLLAPAFDFGSQFTASLEPDALANWRATGWHEFHHYGEQRACPLSIALLDDAASYEAFPDVRVPTLVLHGRRDTVVDLELSAVFARGRPHVERELLDSDHELRDVLEPMWERMLKFLRLPGDGSR